MSDLVDELLNFFEQREGQHISDVDIEEVMEKAAVRIEALEARVQDLLEEVECDEQRVADLMRELAKVPDWISVEDRLPDPTTKAGNTEFVFVLGATAGREVNYYCFSNGTFNMPGGIPNPHVTHWMKLPSPPTNEE